MFTVYVKNRLARRAYPRGTYPTRAEAERLALWLRDIYASVGYVERVYVRAARPRRA